MAAALQADLEVVNPSGNAVGQEYRIFVAAQPLRVRIDQNVAVFLAEFFTDALPEATAPGGPAALPPPQKAPDSESVSHSLCSLAAMRC